MRRLLGYPWLALMLPLCLACASDTGDGDGPPDPAMLACEEAGEPLEDVMAADQRGGALPEIDLNGEPHSIQLPEGATGFVEVHIEDPETLAILFLSAEDVVQNAYHEDETDPIELTSAGPNTFCPDVFREHFDIDFEEAGRYVFELGPSASDEISLVLAGGAGHGHDEQHEGESAHGGDGHEE